MFSLNHLSNALVFEVQTLGRQNREVRFGFPKRARTLSCTLERSEYNRAEEVKAFDATQTGVKGLVDARVLKIPKMFIRPPNELSRAPDDSHTHFQIPIIDLQDLENDERKRKDIIDEIKDASEKWGFFQIVNHGVPIAILEEMVHGVVRFHEQDVQVKKEFYTRDQSRRVRFNSNFDLYRSVAASWRDSMTVDMLIPDPIDPQDLPIVCRDVTMEYTKHVTILGDTLFELLSESLGLKKDYLKQMNYTESCVLVSHYYPACPEPDLTLGSATHTDPVLLTILLQDHIGGLQVLHQDQWIDIQPIPGSLIVNIGDFLQIISNDKLKSVEHRVLANDQVGARVSVAAFLTNSVTKPIGPIKELISKGELPVYREIFMKDYMDHFASQGLDGKSGLDYFRL